MRHISDIISAIKTRQTEIKSSLAVGNPATWEAYQRIVGQHQGLEEALEIINNLLKEEDENE
jgi:hypothetical protein